MKEYIVVTSISFDKDIILLSKGDTVTLRANVLPVDATNKAVSFESSNTTVATVLSNGLIMAISNGTATITVKTNDGSKTANCLVLVGNLPTFSNPVARIIESNSALFAVNIIDAGEPEYTERGFCISTSENQTIPDIKVAVAGTGTGEFSANLTGLALNTIYYVRPYAIIPYGTVYGNQVSFMTRLRGVWTQKAGLGNNNRYDAVGFSILNRGGYIGTGNNANGSRSQDFLEYDPISNRWTQKANFGGKARHNAVGFSIDYKGYIGMGSTDSGLSNDFWEYDLAWNSWTQKSNLAGGNRQGAVGFSIGNKGYIGTGTYTINGLISNDFWEYDPVSNRWSQKANFEGGSRTRAVGFSIGNYGYIGIGYGSGGDNDTRSDFWVYDPILNRWTQKANFAGERRGCAVGFSINTKGYIGTGWNNNKALNDFWEYDRVSNTWTQKADFAGANREEAVGFSIGNKGYIGTGRSGNNSFADFWEFSQ